MRLGFPLPHPTYSIGTQARHGIDSILTPSHSHSTTTALIGNASNARSSSDSLHLRSGSPGNNGSSVGIAGRKRLFGSLRARNGDGRGGGG